MMTSDLDYELLDREMDKVRTKMFSTKNTGFLGPLMCSLTFAWREDIQTACTNGLSIYWNPHWFLATPLQSRVTVLLHELWHVAFLHMLRRQGRDPKLWNIACDIVINNKLAMEGNTFDELYPCMNDGINRWKHPTMPLKLGDHPLDASAEEVYEAIKTLFVDDLPDIGGASPDPDAPDADGDLLEPEEGDARSVAENAIVDKVVAAATAARMAGQDTGLPGEVGSTLKRFLAPKVAWNVVLKDFFEDLTEEDYTYAQRDRRFQDVYLPSLQLDEGGLNHILYAVDVSGSVSDGEVLRSNSEIKYVKDFYNPARISVVQFDTRIQSVHEFYENDSFDEVIIVGRGGTDLTCVREYMLEHRPTAVVVLSDLECNPMEPLPPGQEIPTIWIGINARPNVQVNFGKLIHIRE